MDKTYIPHHLIHELWQPYRMACRALPGRFEGPDGWVGDMALVIWAVDVHAIPAGGEGDGCADLVAETVGQGLAISFSRARSSWIIATAVTKLSLLALSRREPRVSNKHAEPRLEGRYLGPSIVGRNVVHRHSAVSTETVIGKLTHALVCSVAGAKVQDSRPVVGEVLGEGTTGAGRIFDQIVVCWIHVHVEGVASYDLVDVW